MTNKISVITVVYNNVSQIRETMESFFAQTWEDKEYIIIDGGSTDGTVEIIREYADRLAYWCSEPDAGLFDAMNKGISHVTGDWINFLNSGDTFYSEKTLEEVISTAEHTNADIIYGNAVADDGSKDDYIEAGDDLNRLDYEPIYRHGCSLVRADIHKKYLFATEKKDSFGFALDYDVIFRLFHDGYRFTKVSVIIQKYRIEGVSNNLAKSLKYNYLITTQYNESKAKKKFYLKNLIKCKIKKIVIIKVIGIFLCEYFLNSIVRHIAIRAIRNLLYRFIGIEIGVGSVIDRKSYFLAPRRLSIGEYTHINKDCIIDARGGLIIGNNVSISHRVNIMSGSHDVHSNDFHGAYYPISIGDYAWLGVSCTILQNVKIGRGAVVCAGAVVTHDIEPFSIVAGIPAKKIGERNKDLNYKCIGYHSLKYYL